MRRQGKHSVRVCHRLIDLQKCGSSLPGLPERIMLAYRHENMATQILQAQKWKMEQESKDLSITFRTQ